MERNEKKNTDKLKTQEKGMQKEGQKLIKKSIRNEELNIKKKTHREGRMKKKEEKRGRQTKVTSGKVVEKI